MGFTYSLLFLHISKYSSFSNVKLNRMIRKEDLKLQELWKKQITSLFRL